MKITRISLVALAMGSLALIGAAIYLRFRLPVGPRISHQLPYKWDSYDRPNLKFEMEPISNVIAAVNSAIREASDGEVPEATRLDTTPTRIVKVNSDPPLDAHMDQLIAEFREHERAMNEVGAQGFEGTPFTGIVHGRHSLGCTFLITEAGGLHWEAREDALHASRKPREMECRPYRVTDELFARMEQQRKHATHPILVDWIGWEWYNHALGTLFLVNARVIGAGGMSDAGSPVRVHAH